MLFKKNVYKKKNWVIQWLRHYLKVKNGEENPIDEFDKEIDGDGGSEKPEKSD